MLKANIEIISTQQSSWIQIPNGDLYTAIDDFTEKRDYEITIITGLKEDGITSFVNNEFHKCDIFELNDLLSELEENYHFDTRDFKNLSILNMLLEHNNHNVEYVSNILFGEEYRVFHAKDMGDVAEEYLEATSSWYREAKENDRDAIRYFDFKSYGEEVLGSSGTYLQDKDNEIIVQIFD